MVAVLCLALAAIPAVADINNGPINGTTDAWTINFGYVVSDNFVADSSSIAAFMIGVWLFPGDTVTSLDWSITSAEFGGTIYGSGTASDGSLSDQFISSNQYGYNIDQIRVLTYDLPVIQGNTYWLNLANASVPSGDPVYWDENSGPASASESALGTIPSEAYTLNTCFAGGTGSPGCGQTPEPGSLLLLASGVLGVAGVLRLKLSDRYDSKSR